MAARGGSGGPGRAPRGPSRPLPPGAGDPVRRLKAALALLAAVTAAGTLGFAALGLSWLDALYMTVISITTAGYREVGEFGEAERLFTMVLLLTGVGVVLYTLTLLLSTLLEGQVGSAWRRRHMQHLIDDLSGHAVVCGLGRVGRAAAAQLSRAGRDVVVVDVDVDRVAQSPYPFVVGDASDDALLLAAGVQRASVLVASLDTDADSVYVVLTARSLAPDLRIIARARTDDAEAKFLRAGADRVVNPQRLGGSRIASFALSPHVVDYLDAVLHEGSQDFRLDDVTVHTGSGLDGLSVAEQRGSARGPLVLALRARDGTFQTQPPAATVLAPGDVLIAVGTADQLADLHNLAGDHR